MNSYEFIRNQCIICFIKNCILTQGSAQSHSSLKWNSSPQVPFTPLYLQELSVLKPSLTNLPQSCTNKLRPQCLKFLKKSKRKDTQPNNNSISLAQESPVQTLRWSTTHGKASAVSLEFISTQLMESRIPTTIMILSVLKSENSSTTCTKKNTMNQPQRNSLIRISKEPWSTSLVIQQFQVSHPSTPFWPFWTHC